MNNGTLKGISNINQYNELFVQWFSDAIPVTVRSTRQYGTPQESNVFHSIHPTFLPTTPPVLTISLTMAIFE